MRRILVLALSLLFTGVVFAADPYPPIVKNMSNLQSGSLMAITATASSLGSATNPIAVTGSISVISGGGSTVTAVSDIWKVGGSSVTNPNYVTWTVSATVLTATAVAVHGLPDDIYAAITGTAMTIKGSLINVPTILYDSTGNTPARIDPSGAQVATSPKHNEEHRGRAFVFGNTISAMAIATPKFFAFTVPNGTTIHVQTDFVTQDGAYIAQIFSGAYGGTGNTLTSYKVNQTLSTTSPVTAFENSNTTSATALRPPLAVGGTAATGNAGSSRSGGNATQGDDDYIILGAGSYFWKLTAQTANVLGHFIMPYYLE